MCVERETNMLPVECVCCVYLTRMYVYMCVCVVRVFLFFHFFVLCSKWVAHSFAWFFLFKVILEFVRFCF